MRRLSAITRGRSRLDVNVEVVPASRALEGAPRPVHQHGHLGGLGSDGQGARLDAGNVQQVADQGVHVVGLVEDDPLELADHGGIQVH